MSGQKQPSPSSSSTDPFIHETAIPPPPLQFSERSQSLGDFTLNHSLPRVIKCDKATCPSKDELRSNLDINQPLLAFTTRSVRKVSAHSLIFDDKQSEFITVGNGLLIPEDYPGWFAVLGAPDRIRSDIVVPFYRKLSVLSMSSCRQFLVGGSEPVQGLMIQQEHKGLAKNILCPILAGTVLRNAGLYQGKNLETKRKNFLTKGKNLLTKGKKKECEFLKCYDEQDREIFLYTEQTGVFYIISEHGVTPSCQIVQMKDIITRFELPLVVKLIYGRVPRTPCAFTQVLLLTDCGSSQTLIASTLLYFHNVNFELPLGSKMLFHVAKNTPDLLESTAYRRALAVCQDKTPGYVKDMKVVFGDSQLGHDHSSTGTASTQEEKEVKRQSDPAPDQPTLPESSPDATTTSAKDEPPCEHVPKRSASIMSRTSYLSDMSKRIAIHTDSLLLTDQPAVSTSSPCVSPDKTTTKIQDTDIVNISPITTYKPPQPSVISGREYSPVVRRRRVGEQDLLCENCETRHVYDNAPIVNVNQGCESGQLYDNAPIVNVNQGCESGSQGSIAENHDSSTCGHSTLIKNRSPCTKLDIPEQRDVQNSDYIGPSHVGYPHSVQPRVNETHVSTEPGHYSLPDESERPSGGDSSNDDLDSDNSHPSGSSQNSPAVDDATVPAPPTFCLASKEMLIEELRKAGITPTTEIALRGLQLADIINLMDKADEFDDDLVALLPKIGNLDFRQIAICFKGMKLRT